MMIEEATAFVASCSEKTIFKPNIDDVSDEDWLEILDFFSKDVERYFNIFTEFEDIKYFPGLLATFFYRIARHVYQTNREYLAKDFSSIGFSLTGMEIYYSSKIGVALKINHGVGSVIGARTQLGDNVLLHHNVTLGDKSGGRPTLGNNVVVYPGAVIVGNIHIGDNAIIGANAFVDKDIKENTVFK